MAFNSENNLLQQYQYLIGISRDLASTLDLDSLLSKIVSVAAEMSAAEAASILLLDESSQQLYFQAATNIEVLPAMHGMVIPRDSSLAGWVIKNRTPVIANDVENDRRHYPNVDQETGFATRSLMGIPLMAKDEIIGVLETINKREGGFSQPDQDIITILGAQAAIAIQNTRMFHQSDLIAEMVHELRTPLSSLSAVAGLLARPDLSEDQRIKLVHTLHTEVQRLNSMTTSFLDLARLESGRMVFHKSIFPVQPLIEECLNLYESQAAEHAISTKIDIPPDLPRIEADRDELKQVLLNLISNAVKYNRPGGSILLRTGTNEKELFIAVEDNGSGIPEEEIPHLFEKFFRASGTKKIAPGTGLGLSICAKVIAAHRGRITVTSHPGQGSTFTVYLPLKPAP